MSRRTTRRGFAKSLAALAAVPGVAAGQSAPAPRDPADAADALVQLLRLRLGEQIGEEQLRRLRGSVRANLARAERLRAFPLTGADEPAFVYHAEVP